MQLIRAFNFRVNMLSKEDYFLKIFYLFIFMIPISSFVSVRLLFVTFLFSFFLKSSFKNIWLQSWDIFIYLITLIGGLIYSQDFLTGIKVLETNFSFLAIPFVLIRIPVLDSRIRNEIFRSFLLGVIVASLVCLVFAFYRYAQESNIQFFFFAYLTEVINSHPTYLAYYIIFSISVELYRLYYKEYEGSLLFRFTIICFLFFILILTGGQTAFISMLFVFSFFILKFLIDERKDERRKIIGVVTSLLCCMFFLTFIEKDYRILELNDSWERAVLWESAIAAIPHPLIGVGTGDYKIALNEYYTTHDLPLFAIESYNSHNQFIQLLFSNGILGVFSIILMLGRPLYLAMKSNNILVVLCLFPFLMYGMTEVFLGRFQGVVFFALLHQIFIIHMKSVKPEMVVK